ncbi:MAG: hypothetical protein ABSC77_12110 [Terracidiphilus sp.]|jgi:hypothetical protein
MESGVPGLTGSSIHPTQAVQSGDFRAKHREKQEKIPPFPEAVSHHVVQRSRIPVEKDDLLTLPIFAIKSSVFSRMRSITLLHRLK